jgi:hypothetical protein
MYLYTIKLTSDGYSPCLYNPSTSIGVPLTHMRFKSHRLCLMWLANAITLESGDALAIVHKPTKPTN